jgi:hypothetical protein
VRSCVFDWCVRHDITAGWRSARDAVLRQCHHDDCDDLDTDPYARHLANPDYAASPADNGDDDDLRSATADRADIQWCDPWGILQPALGVWANQNRAAHAVQALIHGHPLPLEGRLARETWLRRSSTNGPMSYPTRASGRQHGEQGPGACGTHVDHTHLTRTLVTLNGILAASGRQPG